MGNIEFMHIGITVENLETMVDFYCKYFNFIRPERFGQFGPDFIAAQPALYRQPEGVYSDSAMLRSDYGVTLELFRFSNVERSPIYEWQKTGYHHIAFKVESIPKVYEQLLADGLEAFFEPAPRGPANSGVHWIFFKDPEGNMIELWD
ncbi:MAG: VOC family protein [Clostridiales bacterium]|nr:VOC family protein [Clostridiales bacterium]